MKKFIKKLKQKYFGKDKGLECAVLSLVDGVVRICLLLNLSFMNKYTKKYRRRRIMAATCACLLAVCAVALLGVAISNPSLLIDLPSKVRLPLLSSTAQERIQDVVLEASITYDVPKELIWAVIAAESNFNPRAESRVGAIGLMQLMPRTAAYMKVSDPWDAKQNVFGGTRYLRYLLDKFRGDVKLAVAAYNAGPGAVRRHGGIPPYAETRGYVRKVLNRFHQEKAKAIAS